MNWRGRISIGLGVLVVLAAGAGVLWQFTPHLLYRTEVSIHTGSAWLRTQYVVLNVPVWWRDRPTFIAEELGMANGDREEFGSWQRVDRRRGGFLGSPQESLQQLEEAIAELTLREGNPTGLYEMDPSIADDDRLRARVEQVMHVRMARIIASLRRNAARRLLVSLEAGNMPYFAMDCLGEKNRVKKFLAGKNLTLSVGRGMALPQPQPVPPLPPEAAP